MFSRYDRDALAEVINRYLTDDLSAFKFDEALADISARTKDQTVQHVAGLLWYHYDDLEDHKGVASKVEWDFFQRLLLLLKSDADLVEETGKRRWTASPLRLGSRQIRGPVSEAFNWLHFVVVWLLFSPVALLLQALPEREQRLKVANL